VTLAFATISAVRLGFGYNYSVRMPLMSELHSFPFITDDATKGAGNDPYQVLKAMVGADKPFVFPKEGSYWFCAGMTISAFDVRTSPSHSNHDASWMSDTIVLRVKVILVQHC
jgi:hypothetical protein